MSSSCGIDLFRIPFDGSSCERTVVLDNILTYEAEDEGIDLDEEIDYEVECTKNYDGLISIQDYDSKFYCRNRLYYKGICIWNSLLHKDGETFGVRLQNNKVLVLEHHITRVCDIDSNNVVRNGSFVFDNIKWITLHK